MQEARRDEYHNQKNQTEHKVQVKIIHSDTTPKQANSGRKSLR